jgi:hypothetical protein
MASTAPTSVNVLPDLSNFQQRFFETVLFDPSYDIAECRTGLAL